jgi:uncharacterized membrane protein required for colicin V production
MLKFIRKSFGTLFEVSLWLTLIACAIFGVAIGKILGLILGILVGMLINVICGGIIAVILNIDKNLELLTKKSLGVSVDSEKFDTSSNSDNFEKAEKDALKQEEAELKRQLKVEQAELKRQLKEGL